MIRSKSMVRIVGNNVKGRITKRVLYKKTKHAKLSEKGTFLTS